MSTIKTNLLLIDSKIKDTNVLLSSLNNETFGIIYTYDTSRNSILQQIEANFSNNISRIAIVTHEGVTNFLEKTSFFDVSYNQILNSNFDSNSDKMTEPQYHTTFGGIVKNANTQFILDLLKTYNVSNIDYLACNSLKYNLWKHYYDLIESEVDGVIVGASDDQTGNIKYGGDWVMENTGDVVDSIYFNQGLEYYKYLLTSYNWNIIFKQQYPKTYSNSDYLSFGSESSDNYSILGSYDTTFGIQSSTNFIYKIVWDNGKYLIFQQNKEFSRNTSDLTGFTYSVLENGTGGTLSTNRGLEFQGLTSAGANTNFTFFDGSHDTGYFWYSVAMKSYYGNVIPAYHFTNGNYLSQSVNVYVHVPPSLNSFTITPSTITLETTSATIDMTFNFAITSSEIASSLSVNPSSAGSIDTGSITNTSGTNWTATFIPNSNVDFPSCSITFSNSTYNLNRTINFSVNTTILTIENIELQPSNLITDVSSVLEIQFSGEQLNEPIITIDPSNVAYIDGSILPYNNNTIWRGILRRITGINSLNNVLHVSVGDISGEIKFDVIDDTNIFDVISQVPDISVNESEIIVKDLSDNNLLISGTQEENKIKRKEFIRQLLKNNKSLLQETDKKLIMKTTQLLGNNDTIIKENIKILDNYDSDGNELNSILFDIKSLKPNEALYAPLINVENSIIIFIDNSKIKVHKKSETTYDITEDYIDDTTQVTKTMNEFDVGTYKNLIFMLGSIAIQVTFSMTLSSLIIDNETSSILTIVFETSLPSDTSLNDYITITPNYIASLDTLILQPDGYTWKATLTKTPLVNNYNNTLILNYTPTGVSGEVNFDAVNDDVTYWEKVNDTSLNATYDSDFISRLVMSSDGLIAALGNANNNEVKLYKKNSNIWTLKQTLTDSSYFGSNIAIDNNGENIAISNTNNDYYQQDQSGTFVKVYKLNATKNLWEQKGATLPSSSTLGFGKSISINDSGNILAIGVPNSGHVEIYEYEYSSDSWSKKGTNIVPDISVINFGNSVSLSGNGLRVSIGALNNLKQNFSYIMLYEWNNDNNNWIQMGNNLSFFT